MAADHDEGAVRRPVAQSRELQFVPPSAREGSMVGAAIADERANVRQAGSDRLEVLEADLELLEARLQTASEVSLLANLHQALEEVPAQEPVLGERLIQPSDDALELGSDLGATKGPTCDDRALVEPDHLPLRRAEAPRLRNRRSRELRRRKEAVGRSGEGRLGTLAERQRIERLADGAAPGPTAEVEGWAGDARDAGGDWPYGVGLSAARSPRVGAHIALR